MQRRQLFALSGVSATLVLTALLLNRDPVPSDMPGPATAAATLTAAPTPAAVNHARATGTAATTSPLDAAVLPYQPAHLFDPGLSRSLGGTQPDGALRLTADGHFAADADSIARFDYFLSSHGEMSLDQVRHTLLAHIHQQLPPQAAAEASMLLEQYLSFRQQAEQLTSSSTSAEDMLAAYSKMGQLRDQIFGPALSQQLFGEEEQRQATLMERYLVQQRSDLQGSERDAARQALQASLAADERQVLRQREQLSRLGTNPQRTESTELQRQRSEAFGSEAALRLAKLDAERSAWQQRVRDYQQARQQLLVDQTLSPAQRTGAEQQLLASHFSPEERLRIAP